MEQQYFSFNGDESIIVQRIFKSIKNSFTYELLVKPEEIHKIDIESNEGCSGIHGQKYVISPEHGRTVNEAGVGISIGINGVSVYEHTVNHLPSTLVFPTIIDDWVHVAVVYNNKTSFLYIDGELVAAGVKSAKCNVFASGVFGGHDPYGFFVGQIKYIRIWDHARTKEQIKDKISNGLSDNEQGLFGIWKFKSSSICELLSDTVLPLPKNIKTNDFFRYERCLGYMKTFAFNGYERVSIQSLFYSIKNNFTYEFLTKPEAMHQIDKESSEGCSGIQGQKYVISPEHGQHENEAGVGVSIGINGVSVYEHSENYLPATSVYPAFFDDWVHVAVVYNNKTPSIYINGQFVKTGVTSLKENVFASGVFGGHNPYGFFVGQLKYIRLWDHSRTEEQIKESISQDLIGNEQGLFGYWNFDNQSFSELITNDDVVSVRDHRDGILFVMNQLGGGTELYQNTYIEKIKDQYKVYKLMFQSDSYLFEDINEENYSHILIKSLDLTQKKFINLLNSLNIKLIYVNHLISFQVYEIMDLIQYSGIEYNYFIHDFYCACPRVNLIDKNGIYCNNEVGVSKCQNCMNNFQNISIETWRQRFLSFLLGAHKVIAPSYSTKEIIKKYYPGVSIDVHEHSVSSTIKNTNKSIFAKNKILNIAFIGYIHKIKGSRILYQMMKIIRMKNLPIRIIVIGRTDMHDKFISDDKKFIVTGKYDNTEISELLAKHKISLVISSSVCPETYSYTTSEALLSGYPVITFNIGAPAERVRKLGGGWILEKVNSSSIINLLIKLLDNRNEIIQKANNLRK